MVFPILRITLPHQTLKPTLNRTTMLQLAFLRENKELAVKGLEKKRLAGAAQKLEEVLETDTARRSAQQLRDQVLAEANANAKEIGLLMKAGQITAAEEAKQASASLKERAKALTDEVAALELQLTQLLYQLPNLPHESVPEGATAENNIVVFEEGTPPALPAGALPHWELATKHKLIDFELGNKVTGAGFPFYTGQGARLQRALINFFLDEAVKAGYRETQPPILINEASGIGTGQLPDKEGQMYKVGDYGLYLIPTAEVPLTNIYRDTVLQESDLPIRMAGYTPCFRSEAGSWGAHVRGLNRLHQFDKVELVQIAHPEKSYSALDEMCAHVENLLRKLELPFRKLLLCGGDISFNAALCYDMEVYSAGQQRWLEVSSVSNFETYQANRMSLRFKDAQKKTVLPHTLNGSALALPRIVAALLENNQTPDGVKIPKVLQPYCGFENIGR